MKTLTRTFTTKTRKTARKLTQALKQDGYTNIVTPTSKNVSGWLVGAVIKRPTPKQTFIVRNNKAISA